MSNDSLSTDKRIHARFPVQLPVQYRLLDNPKLTEKFRGKVALAKDLSLQGLYIKIAPDRDVRVGEIFRLDINLPEISKRLFAYGEVVWMNPSGLGLHLMLMPEEDKEALKSYLSQTDLS